MAIDLSKYKKDSGTAVDLSRYRKPQEPERGALGTNPSDTLVGKVLDNSVTRGVQRFFPGAKVGQAIGTLGGYGLIAAQEKLGLAPKGATSAYDLRAPSPLQVTGDVVQGAATVAGLKAPAIAGKGLLTAAKGAGLGAGLGAAGGAGTAAQQTSGSAIPTLEDTKKIASGAAVGGLIGGALGGAITPLANRATPEARTLQTVQKRTKVLSSLEKSNAVVRRALEGASARNPEIKKILAETDILNGAVDANGTVSAKNALANFKQFIAPYEGQVRTKLQEEGTAIPLEQLQMRLISGLDASDIPGEARTRLKSAIAKELQGLAMSADESGRIPLTAVHDSKVFRMANQNYLDKSANAIGKEVARILKEVVEENASSLDVRTFNGELSKLYAVRDVLRALDGKKVEGGRLGKHFSTLIGGVAGSNFGPLGTIVGAEGGRVLGGIKLQSALGGTLNTPLQVSDELLGALKGQSNNFGSRKITQATNIAPIKSVISTTLPKGAPKSTKAIPTPLSRIHPEDVKWLEDNVAFSKKMTNATFKRAQELLKSLGQTPPPTKEGLIQYIRDAFEADFDRSIKMP